MGLDEPADLIQLPSAEAVRTRQTKWLQPNLQVLSSRSTCTCGGSLQSKLVKKTRYGPGIPRMRGILISPHPQASTGGIICHIRCGCSRRSSDRLTPAVSREPHG